MNVAPIGLDDGPQTPTVTAIPGSGASAGAAGDAELFAGIAGQFSAAATALDHAQRAEHAFANGSGGLQEMVFERARADAILNVASAAASKATQSLNTILNIQV